MAPPAGGGGPFAGSPAPRGFGRSPAAAPAQAGLLSPLVARRNTVAARGTRPLSVSYLLRTSALVPVVLTRLNPFSLRSVPRCSARWPAIWPETLA
jgi:hypothetical protein